MLVPVMLSSRIGLGQRVATGTSLAAIVPIALVGTSVYYRGGAGDLAATLCLIPGSLGGAVLGARVTRHMSERSLTAVFAALCLAIAVRLAIPAGLPSGGGHVGIDAAALGGLLLLGAAAGFASGLLGIGGGVLMVPALVLLFGVSQQLAQGTSLAVIVPTGLVGAITHAGMGNVELRIAGLLAAGGVSGAVAGAALAVHLPQPPLRVCFAVYLMAVAARLLRRLHQKPTTSGDSTG